MSQPRSKRPVNKDDLFAMRFLQDAVLAPDGQTLAYAVSQYEAEDDKDVTQLWRRELASGRTAPLTFGKASNHTPAFAPDSRRLAFISERGPKPQLYLLSLDGGEAQALTNLPQGVGGGPVWSPDGRQIAFTAPPPRPDNLAEGRPYRVRRFIYRFDDLGYLDEVVQNIYVLDVESGKVLQLTDDDNMNLRPQWSPDGRELLFTAAMRPDDSNGYFAHLYICDLNGALRPVLTTAWGQTAGACAWHPDGQHIIFAGVAKGLPIGSKSDLYVMSSSGQGEPQNRSAGLPWGVGAGLQGDQPARIRQKPAVIAPTQDGRDAFVRVQKGGTVQIFRIALSGPEAWAPMISGDRCAYLLGLSGDDRSLLFTASDFNRSDDIFLSDIEGGSEEQLTRLNDEQLAAVAKAKVEPMRFPGPDGVEVEGWTIMPAGGQAPFPGVLYIHGGPHSGFGHNYHFDTQMLVGAGYAVIMVNHRASTGYGDSFSTAIKGDWGNLDYGDLMAGVDQAIANGWVDGDRLGVCGLSGGGNLSCWIVGQTDRFKAAIPENPVTNWVSFYGVSDIGPWFAVEQLGGRPHEIPEVYARCSPITYAHNCTTPTLLIQGEQDYRCPAEQSEQFYTVLKANGCPVEMLRLPASSHGGSIYGRPPLRRAHNDALLDWLNRYVLDQPPDPAVT